MVTVPPAPPWAAPDSEKTPATRRRRVWEAIGWGTLGVIVLAAGLASIIRLPYYAISPGSVYGTIERIDVQGDREIPPEGEIGFVTVAQTANISVWEWIDAKLDDSVEIKHEDDVRGDQTADEKREADQRRMQVSKDAAVVVALQRLGFDLTVTPLGVEVAQVFDCSAADGNLGTGDLIVAVNNIEVRQSEELIAQLAQRSIGDEVELLVERIDPNNSARTLRTELVTVTLGSADAECLPDDVQAAEPRPFIGIGTNTIVDEQLPFDVAIDTGRVGGPSAGLAFTLAIIDVLSEGELTNGIKIASTGTIDREGAVGPVGGIAQKTVAAERWGADVFIVPLCCDNWVDPDTGERLDEPSNYEEALMFADDMHVVGVRNLDEALLAIGELGGDVEDFFSVGEGEVASEASGVPAEEANPPADHSLDGADDAGVVTEDKPKRGERQLPNG